MRLKLGDIVRVTFDSDLIEPGQYIEGVVYAAIGWYTQENFFITIPQTWIYSADEEELHINRDDRIIAYSDGRFEFYESQLQGIPCQIQVLNT
jgi:hypothetical protein